MATIYRFVIEQKTTGGNGGGRKSQSSSAKKGAGKKGKTVTFLSSDKGGVESNRKLRAINPLINKMTHGYWEKGMRVGRAGLGLVKYDAETGKFAGLSGPAIAIIIAFVLQTIMKWQNKEREKQQQFNRHNYKAMENGFGAIHGEYETTVDILSGRVTYNENK